MGIVIRTLRSIAKSLGMLKKQNKGPDTRYVNYYTGPEEDMTTIILSLSENGGGNITMEKDETTGLVMICINNPQKRNAFSGKMMVELHNAVTEIEKWKTGKGLILYGAEGHFCSGGDLSFARENCNPHAGFQMATIMTNTLHRLHNLPIMTVAVIEGAGALGGGAELAAACDFRLASTSAAGIGFVHGRMGIIPAWGGVTWLADVVGCHKALDLISSSQIVTPSKGIQTGIIDAIISDDNPLDDAREWLKARTRSDPEVIHAMKAAIRNVRELAYKTSLPVERRIFAPLWGGPANKLALQRNVKHKL
ncbi:ethylmalonyl-CoA decarboxylase-like [Schistocerca gregaria]|uniref:ethylmalonyl-CoA decarboxylase-like n=1 Tax=Schistocerca gregaria TaxID=7010 RepID=UPI00211F26E4|nr:ethylmalonyl-CoA decarboxylase-like [Schistocerca gregaria]